MVQWLFQTPDADLSLWGRFTRWGVSAAVVIWILASAAHEVISFW